jgi:hypothetical protein
MKITKLRLKEIIKEELSRTLGETSDGPTGNTDPRVEDLAATIYQEHLFSEEHPEEDEALEAAELLLPKMIKYGWERATRHLKDEINENPWNVAHHTPEEWVAFLFHRE